MYSIPSLDAVGNNTESPGGGNNSPQGAHMAHGG